MIYVPIWPKNDIRLGEHDFSNFLFFPDGGQAKCDCSMCLFEHENLDFFSKNAGLVHLIYIVITNGE